MSLTRSTLNNPTAGLVAGLLVILFGLLALDKLPVQLTPEVERPEITIKTNWRAAAPEEVESEIIEPQEQQLRGLPGMTELLSEARQGQGKISIAFDVDFDLQRGLIEVINRLNRVSSYPDDADEPILSTAGGRSRPIAWFIVKPTAENKNDIEDYRDYVEEVIQSRFERVPGVAMSEIRGGNQQQIRITVDPYLAAGKGVDLSTAAQLVGGNNDVSGGSADIGKRRYTLRYIGDLSPQDLQSLILEWRDGKPIYLRDIATVEVRNAKRDNFVITRGEAAIAVNAYRENGVNVLDVMRDLDLAMNELRQGPLKRAELSIEQVYDETVYIHSAIALLRGNLGIGILLAVVILWFFLRHFRATLVVTITIPLCLCVAFVVILGVGKSINVVSLAGLAFAIGMVMDAAIIVLENIVRLREKGYSGFDAALKGTQEVWPALLASTATTVAIFLPILFLRDQSGQLFSDLAIAITAAIITSMLVATILIPAASMVWLGRAKFEDRLATKWDSASNKIVNITRSPKLRIALVAALIIIPIASSWQFFPERDYLPTGNRNLAFGFILPPPGVNIAHIKDEMGDIIADRIQPYMTGEKEPKIKQYFFVARSGSIFIGGRAEDPNKVDELVKVLNKAVSGFPDTFAVVRKASLFSGFGANREIEINIQGRNIDALLETARVGFAAIPQKIPGARVRPRPGLELAEPELQFKPHDDRLQEAGWNRQTLAKVTQVLGDGLKVGEYFDGEERLDVILKIPEWHTPEEIAAIPLSTSNGSVVPFAELVSIERTAGASQIRRLDRRRTVTLEVTPPEDVPLEQAINIIKSEIEPLLEPLLPADGVILYGGSADSLSVAIKNLSGSFAIALIILLLLMAALFRSFTDSLLVMMALPLATIGGVAALHILGLSADLLTMIGFIILLGLVVNNAILLVYQARNAERAGADRLDAVRIAVRTRLRPILMSTATTVFGMLPLVLFAGAGSELYRGLAAVIVGGMLVSTLFTLILIPSLLQFDVRHTLRRNS
ncbi:MAG: efflux RND transporter permease subunit [Gammaproteobacteria bacterium]|nr:efflux RND transporter permease subunit [Gammaproteobacteria bacterium]